MRAGDRDRYLTFKAKQAGSDALGQPLETWATVGNAWASVKTMNGLQAIKADSPVSVVQASIRVMYREDIKPGMRAHDGATVYEVRAILPAVSRRVFTDLVCEVVA